MHFLFNPIGVLFLFILHKQDIYEYMCVIYVVYCVIYIIYVHTMCFLTLCHWQPSGQQHLDIISCILRFSVDIQVDLFILS